jgi:hypothetical protein
VAVVPELALMLRWSFTPSFAAVVGYTVMAFPQALRAGEQIDTTFDLSPAATRPAAVLRDSTIWIHGLTLGVEF